MTYMKYIILSFSFLLLAACSGDTPDAPAEAAQAEPREEAVPAPEPAPEPRPAETPPAAQETEVVFEVWDDRKAKEVLKEVKALTKGRRVPMAKRVQAVEMLAAGSNKKLVSELAKLCATDGSKRFWRGQ